MRTLHGLVLQDVLFQNRQIGTELKKPESIETLVLTWAVTKDIESTYIVQ